MDSLVDNVNDQEFHQPDFVNNKTCRNIIGRERMILLDFRKMVDHHAYLNRIIRVITLVVFSREWK